MPNTKKFKIAVCGALAESLMDDFNQKAQLIGQTIAKSGHALFTGVTKGYAYEAVKGAVGEGGEVIGISPASNKSEQLKEIADVDLNLWKYIIYTGLGYKMREVLLVQSVDAVIFVGGGVGTLLGMATAPDVNVLMGIVEGSGGAAKMIYDIEQLSYREKPSYIIDKDPVVLVEKIIEQLSKSA